MLTASQIDNFPNDFLDIWEEYQQEVLSDIARRITGLHYDSATWQFQRIIEGGRVYEETIKKLAAMTGKSDAELKKIFEEAGAMSLQFDDEIYNRAGLNPLPLRASPAVLQAIEAGYIKTNGTLKNLTNSTADAAQTLFFEAADTAYLHITTGTLDYDSAIKKAIAKVGDSALGITYPSGHVDKLDVAMRRAVLTGVTQTASRMQEARAADMGADLVQVSSHIGARPSHAIWQGGIFSLSGEHPRYDSLKSGTGYGTGNGLGGWNCRHSWYPYFEGISEDAYTKQEHEENASKTVTVDGQEITVYEASQQQRAIERKIREWKRRANTNQAAGIDASPQLAKVREWQAKQRSLVKQSGLPRQYSRERVTGAASAPRSKPATKPAAKPKPEPKMTRGILENEIKDQDYETAGLFSFEGDLLFRKDGSKDAVFFTDKEIEKMAGGILTHNHPAGSPFSLEDFGMFFKGKLFEIRAVGKEWTYILTAPDVYNYDQPNAILFRMVIGRAQHELTEQGIIWAGMDYKEANHLVSERFAEIMGLFYTRDRTR